MSNETCFIREYKPENLAGYTLIEGFPGMGLVGTIAAKYISEKLAFKEFGAIESDFFMPIIRINEGMPVHPSRLYISKKFKLVLLIAEQIIPRKHTNDLANVVVEWIKKKKIKRVLSLAGIRAANGKEGSVYGIAANEKSKKPLKKHKIEIIEQGITTGITALILLALQKTDIEAFSILGNAQVDADYRAAAAVIKKFDEMFPEFEIDTEPLLKEAKRYESELIRHIQTMKEHAEKEEIEKKPATPPMYA